MQTHTPADTIVPVESRTVHIYVTARVAIRDVGAESDEAAIDQVDRWIDLDEEVRRGNVEYAEEVVGYLVDQIDPQGDLVSDRFYTANGLGEMCPESAKSTLLTCSAAHLDRGDRTALSILARTESSPVLVCEHATGFLVGLDATTEQWPSVVGKFEAMGVSPEAIQLIRDARARKISMIRFDEAGEMLPNHSCVS